MKRTLFALSAVLIVQVGLAAGLATSASGLSAPAPTAPVLAFKPDAVDHLTITDSDGKSSVDLLRKDKTWVLAQDKDFPASSQEVRDLLRDLTSARQGPPVATSADALTRFKVADDTFERKLTFAGHGKTLATLYLGTSQGTRQVHVRRSDQKSVHRIDFAEWKAPASDTPWLNKTLLKVDPDTITALSWDDLTVTRTTPPTGSKTKTTPAKKAETAKVPHWTLSGTASRTVSGDTMDKLTGALSRLRISGLVKEADRATYDGAHPVLAVKISTRSGDRLYTIVKTADKTPAYAILSQDRPQAMTMAAISAESLAKAFEAATKTLTAPASPVVTPATGPGSHTSAPTKGDASP